LKVLAVGLGGFLGAISRYLLSGLAQSLFRNATFPVGTLIVNVLGCLVIGVLSELAESRGMLSGFPRAFLFIGLLGGFTTFSAFGNETVLLVRDGQTLSAGANILGNVVLGLAAVWVGRVAAHSIWR